MDYAERFNRNRVQWLYELAREKSIGPNAVRVGLLFGTFFQADEREEVRPSYDWIMENAHIGNRSTVAKALKELEKAGFIEIARLHRYRSSYSFPFDGENDWVRKSDS